MANNDRGNIIRLKRSDAEGTPTISFINTYFNDPTNSDIFFEFDNDGNGGTAIWNTCADSLCTENPFTGACSAVDSGNSKLGVLCNFDASICPDSDEVPGDVSVSVSAPSIEELECTLPQCPIPTSGNVIIDSNCTLYNEIEITGSLNITGIPDANGTLPQINDGGSNRLFTVESGGELVIKNIHIAKEDIQLWQWRGMFLSCKFR